MNNTRIVELVIEDDNQELAIDAISLVSAPALETDFVFFGKQKNNLTLAKVDEEKRMLVSPALIPNKQIFRYDPNTDSDYYVYFSPETVRKASELYLKHNNHHKATYEHSDRVSVVLTVESWIIEDTKLDKSNLYGFSLPKGTWMVKMKIENDDLWSKVKDGTLKGLSIEGYFTNKFEQMQKKEPTTEEVRTALKELLSKKKSIKVELGLVEDFKKTQSSNIKVFKKYKQEYKEFIDKKNDEYSTLESKFRDRAIKERKNLVDNIDNDMLERTYESSNIYSRIFDMAKDLGIDIIDVDDGSEDAAESATQDFMKSYSLEFKRK